MLSIILNPTTAQNSIEKNRIKQWCVLIATQANDSIGYKIALDVLKGIFPTYFEGWNYGVDREKPITPGLPRLPRGRLL